MSECACLCYTCIACEPKTGGHVNRTERDHLRSLLKEAADEIDSAAMDRYQRDLIQRIRAALNGGDADVR